MILIGENIHIISQKVKSALENKDENFVKNLLKFQQNFEVIDLNVGPAKGKLDNIFEWLLSLCEGQKISFDSSNIDAIEKALKIVNNPSDCFINSTNADDEKLERLTDLALKYDCNLIALAMSKDSGIPKKSDGRMELVFKIYEKCMEKGISSDKIFFDPLVLPLKADQSQGVEVIDTIKMIKESFEPAVGTIIGLSNISNGVENQYRAMINRVFAVLCHGAGLDCMIADAKDEELYRIIKMLECNNPQSDVDKLYINLSNMVQYFGKVQDVEFDKNDIQQTNIIKTVKVLLNEEVYSARLYV
jgi:cobalamin-dependent methionine synthase I